MIRKLIFSVFFSVSVFVFSQEPISIHLSEKEGLPDIEFYNMLEDSKGFMWLASDKGFFRYDGKEFKNYSNSKQRGLSVFGPVEDHLGRIWCNNISGQFFYVEKEELTTFIDLGNILSGELANFSVTKNALLVFTTTYVYSVDLVTKKIDKENYNTSHFGTPFVANDTIIITTKNHILLKTNDSLKSFVKLQISIADKTGKSRVFKLRSKFFYTQNKNKKNAFFQFDLKNKFFHNVQGLERIESRRIISIFDNDHEVWFATDNGIWVYQFIDGRFKYKKQFLKKEFVTKIVKDKDENYWVTTLTNGIFIIPNINIESLSISEENKNISCLEKIDETTLLFGTNNGNVVLYNIETDTEKILSIPVSSRVSALKYHPKKKISYISKDLASFYFDNVSQKEIQNNDFITVKNFSVLGNGDVLYVSNKKVSVLKEKDKGEVNISIGKRGYTSYYSSDKEEVYIAYVDGLVSYDSNWIATEIRNGNQPVLAISIDETDDGTIWVATFKDGVFGIQNKKVIYNNNIGNGLISNKIRKIKADGDDLWIATDKGIHQFNTINETYKTLTKSDGVLSYAITGIEILKNKVIFSSNKGLFSVEKEMSFKQQSNPEIYFTGVEVNEKDIQINTHYDLSYDQNAIKFNFNVNGFQYNQKGTYQYRLLGFNDDWLTTDINTGNVKYNSLPAGNYTFQVKPSITSYLNENSFKAITLSIKNPFWKTLKFIIGSSLFFIMMIALYYRKIIREKERERQQQVKKLSLDNELISLKLENLRSQMNPHFIFNALNSIQEYIVLNQKKLASEYLGKFADLIRTYLNHSTKGDITLQEEIDCLEMYLELEKLRFEDKLHYAITTSGSLNPDQIRIPTMLVQPYVENALKHGLLHRKTDRDLKINFFIDEGFKIVKCIILDNGVGRDKAEEYKSRSHKNHKSFATKATQDRLDLLNYGKQKEVGVTTTDLFEKGEPIGTQVDISIPFITGKDESNNY
ncbi:MAG: hypothetical protein COA67_06555 [Lutibacter sp.]|nr:MAG: hypothetical protein COA67_06555 [Lutibacter sp.]